MIACASLLWGVGVILSFEEEEEDDDAVVRGLEDDRLVAMRPP